MIPVAVYLTTTLPLAVGLGIVACQRDRARRELDDLRYQRLADERLRP